jgi:hypothetical protein
MSNEQIEKSIKTGYLQISFDRKLGHYLPVHVFTSIVIITLLFPALVNKSQHELNKSSMYFLDIIFLMVAGVFYFYQRKKLKFQVIEIELKREIINEIIKNIGSKLDWEFKLINEKLMYAERIHKFKILWPMTDRIAIIFKENSVLVNSVTYYTNGQTAYSYTCFSQINEDAVVYYIKKGSPQLDEKIEGLYNK